jgi:hypothetical protein
MAINIVSPASNSTLHNNQILATGTVSVKSDPVKVSLYQNGTGVQLDKKATVTELDWKYTFTNVSAGSGYTVTARNSEGEVAEVTGLKVTNT